MRTELVKKCQNLSTRSKLVTTTCKNCFKDIKYTSFTSLFIKNIKFCNKCFKQFNPVFYHFKIQNIDALSIYYYDETIQKYLYQLKGLYDIEIANAFLERYVWYLKIMYRNYYLIPCPSYKTHDEERGFNHVVEIFKILGLKMLPILKKNKDYKQSDQKGKDRQKIKDVLELENKEKIKGKKILIVDDVFTTGSTIKASIKLIEKEGPKKIKVLVVSKVKQL